ncbi:MAG: invasion associated locus B family protein [Bauldia sp.]|nr:invasion associated locus B family protein [Bauldia sp.]
MHNDVDDRRRLPSRAYDRNARYQELDDEGYDYEDDGVYEDDGRVPHDPVYDDFDETVDGYDDDIPPRRSRLVPILTIVAALLAVAIAVVVVLYALGVFDGGSGSTTVATDEQTPVDLSPDNAPAPPDVREVTVNQVPADPATDAPAPDVRDAAVSIAPPAESEPPVRSTHGDWQVRCDTPAGAQSEQCVLMQFVTAEDRDNVGLTVIVLKTADGQARIMRILAPLGVLLPSGLGLKIDDTDIGRAGFVRCLPNGCVAEVILEEDLLGQLNKGKTATFIIFQTPEEGIGIPISLAGFGEGFQALP